MYSEEDRLVLSPSDLVARLLCPHLTTLSFAAATGERTAPIRADPELDVLTERGLEHEAEYLTALEGAGASVVRVECDATSLDGLRDAERLTLEAMRAGVDIIFQATFLDETDERASWRGHADFLRRVDRPSTLGEHSYEPEDTKLARRVHPGAVIQLAHYAEQLERLQGVAPDSVHVVLGDQTVVSVPLHEVDAYYRAAKERFVTEVLSERREGTYPLPVGHCAVCRWAEVCTQQRVADDHLCLVPHLTRDQARKLTERAGVTTVEALARTADGLDAVGIGPDTVERHHRQARLQVAARTHSTGEPPPWEFLAPPEPDRGLGALPEPDDGDVFFDIEGDPFVGSDGLEYLFGAAWSEGGTLHYRAWWAHSPAEEKVALEEVIDFLIERRSRHPSMHVYHYAPYEPSALGRLMGRHATREEELDQLLRGRVFVDLYRVVRQGLIVGTDSYSLKKLEPLYMPARTETIADAASSIVAYEAWLRSGDQAILDDLEAYNRVDCESTAHLRDWLEDRHADAGRAFGTPAPRPSPPGEVKPESAAAASEEITALVTRLTAGFDAADPGLDADQRARLLLAHLLDWHRREAKPQWWRYFHLVLDCTSQDLYEDSEAVAALTYEGEVGRVARSTVHRYRFPPDQEHKLRVGSRPVDPDAARRKLFEGVEYRSPGVLVGLDPVAGTLDLQRADTPGAPHPGALVPQEPFDTSVLRNALVRLGEWVAEHGTDGDGPYRAALDILFRHSPRGTRPGPDGSLTLAGEEPTDAAVRLAADLDGGCLAIQGPPGSGKTHAAAEIIVSLVADGRQVAVTAQSHAVIANALGAVAECARRRGVHVRCLQKVSNPDDGCDHPDVECTNANARVVAALDAGEVDVVAGTAWLFAREELARRFDHLVVDEAGQLSLANVCAVAGTARNLVLIGDPRQLAQPSTGSHPPGAQVSALDHLLAGHDTVPAELGLFMDRTWRLHPEICAFVSETSYEGRLHPRPGTEQRTVDRGPDLEGAGIRWVPVEHAGNRTSSQEEAQVVAALYRSLLGRSWTDGAGEQRPLAGDDILVVAPYNAQVHLLGTLLPAGARIGTVDRFQGQEGPVVLVSLAASRSEDVPRGMEFLYDRNRLNVAVSRAQSLCAVVGSPGLLEATCRSLYQLRLANGLCRYVELAATVNPVTA